MAGELSCNSLPLSSQFTVVCMSRPMQLFFERMKLIIMIINVIF